MKLTGLLSLACAAMLTVACNSNGRSDVRDDSVVGTAGEAEHSVTAGDRKFVEDLTYAGAAEIELGRMAAERGGNADVKRFGQMMVDDHSKAGKELKDIAMQYRIPQPAGLDEKHRELMDKLAKLRGAEFDKQYIDAMVQGHEDVVDKPVSQSQRNFHLGVPLAKTRDRLRHQDAKVLRVWLRQQALGRTSQSSH